MNNAKKTEDFLRYTGKKTCSFFFFNKNTVPPVALCLFFLSSVIENSSVPLTYSVSANRQYFLISVFAHLIFVSSPFRSAQAGLENVSTVYLSRGNVRMHLWYSLAPGSLVLYVCDFHHAMTSFIYLYVCPCVQCAGSVLRATLWDTRTSPWLLRLSRTGGRKYVILQTPPSLLAYKVQ